MASGNTNISVFRSVDTLTVFLYMVFVICGAISIYAASYDYDNASLFDFSEFSGKQFMWVGISLFVAMSLLLIEARMYETYAYLIYVIMVLVLIATIFIAPDIKGSRSWIVLGPISLQPAELAKSATALALAKLFSSYNFVLNRSWHNYLRSFIIIFIPIVLILAQRETGSALVYVSLIFVLYREGMSGIVLFSGLLAIVYFVVGVKFTETIVMGIPSGQFSVFIMVMVVFTAMLFGYCKAFILGRNVMLGFIASGLIAAALSSFDISINGYVFFLSVLGIAVVYVVIFIFSENIRKVAVAIAVAAVSVAFMFSVNYVFSNVLEPHQQMRIKVALGIEQDLRGAGYNVNQSKIAIGSGGFWGKGFLNGTQTKLKYVPEQHTDFIFCTIGEEEGFWGSALTLILFLALILRIIFIAERQPTTFARIYAYCVASYLIFHICINIGMVIGLCPVIGIPLPFFSYGGSAILGFTILLFILLRLDAARRERVNY